jgi:hypothetical protein
MKRGGEYNTDKRDIRSRKRRICKLVPVGHSLRSTFPKAFEDNYNSTQFPLSGNSPTPIETTENLYNPVQRPEPPKVLTKQQRTTEKRLNTYKRNKGIKAKTWAEKKEHRAEQRDFNKKRREIKRFKAKFRRYGFSDNMKENIINARKKS